MMTMKMGIHLPKNIAMKWMTLAIKMIDEAALDQTLYLDSDGDGFGGSTFERTLYSTG